MLPNIVPVTEVKRNAAHLLDQLREDKRPILITEHGRAAAVLLDVGSYEELTKRADILDRVVQIQPEIIKAMAAIWGDVAKAMQALPPEIQKGLNPGAVPPTRLPEGNNPNVRPGTK